MRKSIFSIIAILFVLVSCTTTTKKTSNSDVEKSAVERKTQAYLGLKEGGEWKFVTKANGNEQYEYQGGTFKSVESLKMDEKHTDHSFDIQFEGPGWESDKIGYRLYLDWRNATDIFGKKVDTLVLHKVGLDGFDSYHEMCDWGVDVLKVGSSLGIGALGFWDGEKATRVEKTDSIFCSVESGDNSSSVQVQYHGWEIADVKTDLSTALSIETGSYLTKYDVSLSNEIPNIATGIVKNPDIELVKFDDIKEGWGCIATFGVQTLQSDNLGMCVFYRMDQLVEVAEDKYSHVVVLKPENNQLTYYFGAAWEQDASKVKTIDEFKELLKEQAQYIK